MNDLKGIIEDCNKSDLVSDKVIKKIIEIIGQEEWQDLHDENNDVCTTMGELIITLKGIADLEKENTELKEKVNILYNCDRLGDMITEAYKDQLTKAKELLKKVLDLKKIVTKAEEYLLLEEAEQFLNSEVEK